MTSISKSDQNLIRRHFAGLRTGPTGEAADEQRTGNPAPVCNLHGFRSEKGRCERASTVQRRPCAGTAWLLKWGLGAAAALTVGAAMAQCATPFRLSGKIDEPWARVTNNQWSHMLPKGWKDKGFHFYSRVRDRGPKDGINTPSDLESEIRKSTNAHLGGKRWEYVLNLVNSQGQHLNVIYDIEKNGCELVTLTY